ERTQLAEQFAMFKKLHEEQLGLKKSGQSETHTQSVASELPASPVPSIRSVQTEATTPPVATMPSTEAESDLDDVVMVDYEDATEPSHGEDDWESPVYEEAKAQPQSAPATVLSWRWPFASVAKQQPVTAQPEEPTQQSVSPKLTA